MSKGNPTFWGFEGHRVVLKGSLGAAYRLDTSDEALAQFTDTEGAPIAHGTVLSFTPEQAVVPSTVDIHVGNNGYYAKEAELYMVLGVLNHAVWVHHLSSPSPRGAFPLPVDVSECVTVRNVAAALSVPQDDIVYVEGSSIGAAASYALQLSELKLFDVEPNKPYYLSLFDSLVEFRGVVLHVPWVTVLDAKGRRTAGDSLRPLPGCWDADILRSLYGLCDAPVIGNVSSYTHSPRTTPRSAGAPAYRVTVPGRTAVCKAAFGHSLEADISMMALTPFSLHHGDRVMVLRGPDSGRTAVIVGVSKGTLVVALEGDARVTVVRGCNTAEDVKAQFAVGNTSASAAATQPRSAVATPAKNEAAVVPSLKTPRPAAQQVASSSRKKEAASASLSPRSRGTLMFRCWTAFGRYEFDVSPDRIAHFGPFEHEDSVRATRGSSTGTVMTVVGERNGILWVVEKGKVRATPLSHCTNASELATMYGLEHVGKSSLKHLAEIVSEPPPTPLGSPRGDQSSRRSCSVESASASPDYHHHPPAAAKVGGVHAAVPAIRGFPTGAARLLDMEAPTTSSSAAAASPSPAVMSSGALPDWSQPSTGPNDTSASGRSARNYLKAVAMFMLGTTNQNRMPLPFFEYYSVDTTKRLSGALKRLEPTRLAWQHVEKVKENPKAFSEATVDELLRFLAKNPHLLPQL